MGIESKEIMKCTYCEKDLEKLSKQKQQIVQETGCKAAVRTNMHNDSRYTMPCNSVDDSKQNQESGV